MSLKSSAIGAVKSCARACSRERRDSPSSEPCPGMRTFAPAKHGGAGQPHRYTCRTMPFDATDEPRTRRWLRWLLATLPLAPLTAIAYVFSEWLFFVTKPSPTSALPFAQQLLVLLKAP